VAAVPLGFAVLDETKPGFVDQGGGLEGLTGAFAGETGSGEMAEFVVDGREEFFGRGGALVDGVEYLGEFRHWRSTSRSSSVLPTRKGESQRRKGAIGQTR